MRGLKSFACAIRLLAALDAVQLVERDLVRVPPIGAPCTGGRSYVRAHHIAAVITGLGRTFQDRTKEGGPDQTAAGTSGSHANVGEPLSQCTSCSVFAERSVPSKRRIRSLSSSLHSCRRCTSISVRFPSHMSLRISSPYLDRWPSRFNQVVLDLEGDAQEVANAVEPSWVYTTFGGDHGADAARVDAHVPGRLFQRHPQVIVSSQITCCRVSRPAQSPGLRWTPPAYVRILDTPALRGPVRGRRDS
jgi:hypothetical protein